jgi:hypothetical protein
MEGVNQNKRFPELYWDVGRFLGQKIGHSDEKVEFREFFRRDPDFDKFDNGPDPVINPDNKSNYLVAKKWWIWANEREETQIQHIMARALFRMHPAKAQMDHAAQLQDMGLFGDKTREAWKLGLDELTLVYGKELYNTPAGDVYQELSDPEQEIPALARKNNETEERIRHWVDRTQNMTNYRYWRVKAQSELDPEIALALYDLYRGEEEFKQQNFEDSRELLLRGAENYALIFTKKEFRGMADEWRAETSAQGAGRGCTNIWPPDNEWS